MGELRKNPLTREWAVIADDGSHAADADATCPYCTGNESASGAELLAYRNPQTEPNMPGWWVRVVSCNPSHFRPDGDPDRHHEGIYDTMRAIGAEELIVETPNHDQAALIADPQQAEDALWACRERYAHWCASQSTKSVIVSRHCPARSPAHPHWRLLALPIVPQRLWELAKGMEQYYDYRGRCGICHIALTDTEDGRRLVTENRHFLAVTPYAATYSYEIWIIPRRHHGSLARTQRQEMQSLARIIGDTMKALGGALRDPRCVMTLMCAPCNIEGMEHFHWFLRVLCNGGAPTRTALEYGISVNPVNPETAARQLRRAAAVLLAPRL
jgi:UDPglucose--hexose-1-phosphate uridylyltransferase